MLPPVADLPDLRIHIFQIFYLGVMLWILLWAVRDYWIQPQPVTAWFILYQAVFVAYDIAYIGYLGPFLPAELGNNVTSFFVMAIVSAGIRFHSALFALYEPPRWLIWAMNALLALFPAQLVAMATGHAQIALEVNSSVVLFCTVFLVIVPWTARKELIPSRRALRLTYGVMTAMLLTSMLPMLGIVRAVEWHLQSTLVHGLVSASLMFLMLHLRSRRLLDEGRRARVELEVAQRQLMLEKEKQDEQARFMAMLTHELKTPISVVRLALGLASPSPSARRHAQTALDDIDAIIERCQLSDQLHQGQLERLTTRPMSCRIGDLLRELRIGSAAPERVCIESDATLEAQPEVRTDPQLLRVILSNLLDNGLKYSAPSSNLHVRAVADADATVRVEFLNQPGPAGLPDPERVFSRYYRSPGAHGRSGSGQGLYIVQGLAKLLGARVDYDVHEAQVRFTLCIPR